MPAIHFSSAADFRLWLEKNHAIATELHVGFHRKNSGLGGMTYKEAVDEALCFGWIDGIIRKINATSFTHRFTPRKTTSIWSNINIGHVERLIKACKMHSAGLRAFAARQAHKVGIYSFEQKNPPVLPPAYLKKFKAYRAAWSFFSSQAPWYQRKITHKIVSGKRESTRLLWLDRIIAASAAGKRL